MIKDPTYPDVFEQEDKSPIVEVKLSRGLLITEDFILKT